MTHPLPFSRKGRRICFAVRLRPGAGRNEVTGVVEGALRVRVAAPPVENRANQALVAYLAELLGIARDQVSLIAGRKSHRKLTGIEGLSEAELLDRLTARCDSAVGRP